MKYASNFAVIEALKTPHPVQFAPQAHLSREIEMLQNENNFGTYVILGLSLFVVGMSVYLVMEKKKREMIERKLNPRPRTFRNIHEALPDD